MHELSARANGPFVAVNVGAIPETLIESELFGHECGAFTGAGRRRAGKFEQAAGGTLFLDEIGDAPLPDQVNLLRALAERQIHRLGGTQAIDVGVRALLTSTLARTGGRIYGVGGAAEVLGLKPTTLQGKLRKHGLDPARFRAERVLGRP